MNYKQQADQFLSDTGSTLTIAEAIPQKPALWSKKGDKSGINYTVTLKNKRGIYTFDFWDSIHNSEIVQAIKDIKIGSFFHDQEHYKAEDILKKAGIPLHKVRMKEQKAETLKQYLPTNYDILACLKTLQEDTLEDFCGAFGYDPDSITAEKTFRACLEQDRNLRKLFTMSELEELQNIN